MRENKNNPCGYTSILLITKMINKELNPRLVE